MLDQIQGVGRGTTATVRITAAQADELAGSGMIDHVSHQALRDALAIHPEVDAQIEILEALNQPASASSTGGKGSKSPSITVKTVGPAVSTTTARAGDNT